MTTSDPIESGPRPKEGCLRSSVRALVFGLGAGLTYAGIGLIRDYPVGGLAFLLPGVGVLLASLFYRGPNRVLQKVAVAALGLLLMLPVILLVLFLLFAIDGLIDSL